MAIRKYFRDNNGYLWFTTKGKYNYRIGEGALQEGQCTWTVCLTAVLRAKKALKNQGVLSTLQQNT